MQTTAGYWTAIFFVSGVVLGSYFTLNLFVAVMNEKFDVASAVFESGDELFKQIDANNTGDFGMDDLNAIFVNNGIYLNEVLPSLIFESSSDSNCLIVMMMSYWLGFCLTRSSSQMSTKTSTTKTATGRSRRTSCCRGCGGRVCSRPA